MESSNLNTNESREIFQRHLTQRQLLTDVSHRIASSAGLAETLPHILSGICEVTRAAGARIVLEEPGGLVSFSYGEKAETLAIADDTIHHFSQQQSPPRGVLPLDNLPEGLDLSSISDVIKAVMILSLHAQQSWQGTLWIGFSETYDMPDDEYEFINLLTLQAAIAIANSRAFEAARSGREQLAAILASAMDAIIMVDNRRKIQVFNPAAESLFGSSANQMIGKPFKILTNDENLLSLVYPESYTGDENETGAIEYIADGTRTFAPHVSRVIAENGDTSGYLLVLRDVSHFKRLVENMSEFLHTVSHDLRSPLTAAKGNLDMLPMVGELSEKQQSMQQKILTSLVDMTNLIEKVLDAGRLDPEMGTYQLRRETCDPGEIINKIVSTLSNSAARQSIELHADVAPDVPILNLDDMMLERALTNLAENAIKYSPEGTSVTIQAKIENNNLVLSVIDNGYGISEEDQINIFDRGKRIRRKEHRAVRGSGLGLFIVKNVAEQHGGEAILDSKVGQGSRFSIVIPLLGQNLVGSS